MPSEIPSIQQRQTVPFRDPVVPPIAANLATIVLTLLEGWNLTTVLLIYWFQSVTIGFFTVIRFWALLLPVMIRPTLARDRQGTGVHAIGDGSFGTGAGSPGCESHLPASTLTGFHLPSVPLIRSRSP